MSTAPRPSRRTFLSGASVALCGAPRWLAGAGRAARERDRALVVVQLRGGNDGLNTVVPKEDARYYRARPDLALAAERTLPLDELHGFHPSLPRLARRYADGGVGVLRGVGYPGTNLSHFRSQDVWDCATTALPLPEAGWIGAWCDEELDGDPSPLAMLALGRDVLPRAMRAGRALACAVPDLDRYRIETGADAARRAALEAMTPPDAQGRLAPLASALRAARASIEELARTRDVASAATYPACPLGRDLRLAARVLASGLPTRFVYVTQDGYDTHAHQPGPHATLLSDLDAALDAFLTDLAAHGVLDRVLVMTISEFGRRVAQNGVGETCGSDHGAGSLQLFLGGGARPGLRGPAWDLDDLDADGNLVPRVDFRSSYAAVVADWLGGDPRACLGADYPRVEVVA